MRSPGTRSAKTAKTVTDGHFRPNRRKPRKMNSQPSTSYSTSYTLWGLSRRYLAILMRDITTRPIINGAGLRNFQTKSETYAWRGGVPKCVIFDVRSIFEVQFLSESSPFIWSWWDLKIFRDIGLTCVRENRTISHVWILITQQFEGPPSPFFSEFLHRNTIYEKLAWSLQYDTPLPGSVPVKTPHSAKNHNAWKKLSPNSLGACLNGVFSKVCGPISVKISGFVEMETLYQSTDICSNLPTPSVP